LIKPEKTARTVQQNIKCWKSSNGNEIIFNFESNKKIEFQLMSSKDKQVIAETAVEVSWVHEATPRKRRWRIF
jgi:regulatory protein YycH of two-component signal transduction system YycFG